MGREYSEAIYDEFKNRLGNLTLLEKPINIAAGNDFYSLKRTKYTESGNYLTRSLSALVDVGQNNSIGSHNKHISFAFENWGAEEIESANPCSPSLHVKLENNRNLDTGKMSCGEYAIAFTTNYL